MDIENNKQDLIDITKLSAAGRYVLTFMALACAREEHRLRLKRLALPVDSLARQLNRAAAIILSTLSKELQLAAPVFDDLQLNDYEAIWNNWLTIHFNRYPEDKEIFDKHQTLAGAWFMPGRLRWWAPIVTVSLEEFVVSETGSNVGISR